MPEDPVGPIISDEGASAFASQLPIPSDPWAKFLSGLNGDVSVPTLPSVGPSTLASSCARASVDAVDAERAPDC